MKMNMEELVMAQDNIEELTKEELILVIEELQKQINELKSKNEIFQDNNG